MSTVSLKGRAFSILTEESKELDESQLSEITQLFHLCYEQGMAFHENVLVAFGIGNSLRVNIHPLCGKTLVALAGIGCCQERFRRHGIFSKLVQMAVAKPGLISGKETYLMCGRMAHPASMRALSKEISVIPKLDIQCTPEE